MKSQPFAVIELPAVAPCSVEEVTDDPQILMGPSNAHLQTFIVRLAWAFASAVLLLVVVSLLLVVAGYAGSIVAPDVQPKALSTSWIRK